MNETSGTVATNLATTDDAGTYPSNTVLGNPGPISNDSQSLAANYTNQDYQFQAPTSSLNSSISTTGTTVEFWFDVNRAPSSNSNAMALYTGNGFALGLYPETGGWEPFINDPYFYGFTEEIDGSPTPNLSSGWHYLAFTSDETTETLRLYLDGNLVGTDSAYNSDNPIGDTPELAAGWQGELADIAVYPTALSEAQIGSHYNAALEVLPPPPVPNSTFYGPSSPSSPGLKSNSHGEPVNDAIGNFSATKTDLTIRGEAIR
jgi:hypothetical protein